MQPSAITSTFPLHPNTPASPWPPWRGTASSPLPPFFTWQIPTCPPVRTLLRWHHLVWKASPKSWAGHSASLARTQGHAMKRSACVC